MVTCIIFLNFIIAETSASYETVKSKLEAMIYKEKASLISEAETMVFQRFKDNKRFPKYVVIREIATWTGLIIIIRESFVILKFILKYCVISNKLFYEFIWFIL